MPARMREEPVRRASSSARVLPSSPSWRYPWWPISWPRRWISATTSPQRSAVHPGTKNVVVSWFRSRKSRISGTPTLGPYAPWDMTLSRPRLAGSREIQAVSASRSKVRHTADRTPRGQVIGGRMTGSFSVPDELSPR